MNKTLTINISGIVFHIEEDAYESLSIYLSSIKSYLNSNESGSEIMADVEARIAELLQQKLSHSKQVILLTDVDFVKEVMGKPQDFGMDSGGAQEAHTSNSTKNENNYSNEKIKRRLFRNSDEKTIGGVCSGLAAYFDIDTVWVRLIMFLLIFFGGLSLWVYIIMWIIIPEAKTTAEKLAMRGEPANFNSIYNSFKEEAEDLKHRTSKAFKQESEGFKNTTNKYNDSFRNQNYGERVRSNVSSFLNNLFSVIGRLFGLLLVIIGAILLFAYVTSLTGITIANSSTEFSHWKSVIFQSSSIYILSVMAFVIVVGIPVLMLLYAGVKLLFRIHYSNRWINISLGIVWVFGIIIASYIAIITAKQFGESSRSRQANELNGIGDTIFVRMNNGLETLKKLNAENFDDMETFVNKNNSGFCFAEKDDKLCIVGYPNLNISESENDSIEFSLIRSARGATKKIANENAHLINFNYQINKNEIILDKIFTVENGSKFRAQELDIKIKLPKGKVIYFDKSVKHMLDDVENTSNTWDGDMVNRRWKMTDKGLTCLDCNNLRSAGKNDEDENEKKIEINKDGIKVIDKESRIKIDEDGIEIKSPHKEKEIIIKKEE